MIALQHAVHDACIRQRFSLLLNSVCHTRISRCQCVNEGSVTAIVGAIRRGLRLLLQLVT